MLATAVVLAGPGPLGPDGALLDAHDALHSPASDAVVLAVTRAGGKKGLIPLGLLIVAMLLWRRRFRLAGLFAATVLSGWGLNLALKLAFERPRPFVFDPDRFEAVYRAGELSFPSGHAQASATFAVFVALWAMAAGGWARRTLALLLLLPLVMGWTRVYLGVHYPSDVIAGWALGAAWAMAAWQLGVDERTHASLTSSTERESVAAR